MLARHASELGVILVLAPLVSAVAALHEAPASEPWALPRKPEIHRFVGCGCVVDGEEHDLVVEAASVEQVRIRSDHAQMTTRRTYRYAFGAPGREVPLDLGDGEVALPRSVRGDERLELHVRCGGGRLHVETRDRAATFDQHTGALIASGPRRASDARRSELFGAPEMRCDVGR